MEPVWLLAKGFDFHQVGMELNITVYLLFSFFLLGRLWTSVHYTPFQDVCVLFLFLCVKTPNNCLYASSKTILIFGNESKWEIS